MKCLLSVFLVFFVCAGVLRASAPDETSAPPGGDVLKPGQKGARSTTRDEYPRWYAGFDAGLTYSATMKTLPAFYTYTVDNTMTHHALSNMENGTGLGFDLGAALEVHLTPVFGLVGKVHYNTRRMEMSPQDHYTFAEVPMTFPPIWQSITPTADYNVVLDFTSTNIDLLARFQIPSSPVYFLIGPSIGFLGDKKVKYTDIIITGKQYPDLEGTLLNAVNETRYDLKGGIGGWFPLSRSVFFTPELTVSYPLNSLLKNGEMRDANGILLNIPEVKPFEDFNFLTVFLTAGIRFGLN